MLKTILATLLFCMTALGAETTPTVTATSPKEACEALAKAATADDFKAFSELTAAAGMMGMHGMTCDNKDCPMKGKHDCTGKNCPMHQAGKGKAKGKDCGTTHGMNMEERFHKMHAKELERLKDLTCKEEKVVGEHAWVEAMSQKETRLVPFKMVEGKWKFDIRTYHSFYRGPMTETETKQK